VKEPKPILYTTRDLADVLQISERQARRLIVTEQLKAVVVGRRYRVRPADVDAYLEKNETCRGRTVRLARPMKPTVVAIVHDGEPIAANGKGVR
jgi:excisionase family DNA binding protein